MEIICHCILYSVLIFRERLSKRTSKRNKIMYHWILNYANIERLNSLLELLHNNLFTNMPKHINNKDKHLLHAIYTVKDTKKY